MLSKISQPQSSHIVRFYLFEISRIDNIIKTEHKTGGCQGQGRGEWMGENCLMGKGFYFEATTEMF